MIPCMMCKTCSKTANPPFVSDLRFMLDGVIDLQIHHRISLHPNLSIQHPKPRA